MSVAERRVEFVSGDLRIEGALTEGAGDLGAAVLHPHPQYGGDMGNNVVMALRDLLAARGVTVLRFNFRGTGRSQGAHDGGAGEVEDARAALAYVRAQVPESPVVLCGYSFGAAIAARVAVDADIRGLVLVSPPVGIAELPVLPSRLDVLCITGEADGVAPAALVLSLDDGSRHRAAVVPDADHSWWGRTEALSVEVGDFLDRIGCTSS